MSSHEHRDAVVAAAGVTSHPTAGGSLYISRVKRSIAAAAQPRHLSGRNGDASKPLAATQMGRTEHVARPVLRFVSSAPSFRSILRSTKGEKCGPTNCSPTQRHFPEMRSELGVNSF